MGRIIIAGTGSGCGKTTVTSGLLQCLTDRNIKAASFKCGPDYIDPMFHSRIIGVQAGNLDGYFSDEDTLKYIVTKESEGCSISVIEGVMGYYDGIGFTSRASTFEMAEKLDTPAVLVVDARGMGASVMALLQGFLNFSPQYETYRKKEHCARNQLHNHIAGVIFNRMSEKLYRRAAEAVELMGVRALGYIPVNSEIKLESRHLGLVTAGEVSDLRDKLSRLAQIMEKTVDIDGIIELADTATVLNYRHPPALRAAHSAGTAAAASEASQFAAAEPVRIALAEDEAFCFTYRENLEILKEIGCELVRFSPVHDEKLPKNISGLILSGGYPELYASELGNNKKMLDAVRNAVSEGMPVIAECGGFMYLHSELEGDDGIIYPMADVIKGSCYRTNRLGRFGYIELTAETGGLLCPKGSQMKAHEFHYWDSTCCGEGFTAVKADGSRNWKCGIVSESMYAGFPHLFFYESPEAAVRFRNRCIMKKNSENI